MVWWFCLSSLTGAHTHTTVHVYLNASDTFITTHNNESHTTSPAHFAHYLVSPHTVITYALKCISILTNSPQASRHFTFKPHEDVKLQFSLFLNYLCFLSGQDKLQSLFLPAVSLLSYPQVSTEKALLRILDRLCFSLCSDKVYFRRSFVSDRQTVSPLKAFVFSSLTTKSFPCPHRFNSGQGHYSKNHYGCLRISDACLYIK